MMRENRTRRLKAGSTRRRGRFSHARTTLTPMVRRATWATLVLAGFLMLLKPTLLRQPTHPALTRSIRHVALGEMRNAIRPTVLRGARPVWGQPIIRQDLPSTRVVDIQEARYAVSRELPALQPTPAPPNP